MDRKNEFFEDQTVYLGTNIETGSYNDLTEDNLKDAMKMNHENAKTVYY